MPIKNALASIAVKDLSTAIPWYETLIGRPVDSRPMAEVTEGSSNGLGGCRCIKTRSAPDRDRLLSRPAAWTNKCRTSRSVDPGRRMISEKVNVVMIKDPDGNSIAFAEAIDRNIAQ